MNEFKPKVWMTCPLCNKQSPFPDPDYREWVGLTNEDMKDERTHNFDFIHGARWAENKLKERNT